MVTWNGISMSQRREQLETAVLNVIELLRKLKVGLKRGDDYVEHSRYYFNERHMEELLVKTMKRQYRPPANERIYYD